MSEIDQAEREIDRQDDEILKLRKRTADLEAALNEARSALAILLFRPDSLNREGLDVLMQNINVLLRAKR